MMKANFTTLVNELATIFRGGAMYQRHNGYYFYTEYQSCPCRDWHSREQRKYPLHPAVVKALESDHQPHDWHLLTLEWAHVSEDSTRLAYTRDERAGIADRQTVTTVGKYITRHFKTMPDHEVRNLVALYSAGESCKFVHTMAEMLHHLHRGPPSCMVHVEVCCSDGERRHPYQVYDPQYGWHMAVRTDNDDTVGRALCMNDGKNGKYFVRTYEKTGGYSHADQKLHAWLLEQGYAHRGSYYNGTKLAYIETSDDFLAPYIDGGEQHVDIRGDRLQIDDDGEYECGNTSGIPSGGSNRPSCEDCGDRFDDGDGYWVGVHEETHICSSCCDNDYTYAYGRRGNQYYIQSGNTVEVYGNYYDEDYLSDNEIVQLENGGYESADNCVDIDGDWYHYEDERICRPEDSDDYHLTDDCWLCEESNEWYTDDTECVEIDGSKYHPDHAPEQTTEEE